MASNLLHSQKDLYSVEYLASVLSKVGLVFVDIHKDYGPNLCVDFFGPLNIYYGSGLIFNGTYWCFGMIPGYPEANLRIDKLRKRLPEWFKYSMEYYQF